MTVQTSTTVATGIGNGVTTQWPVGYKFNRDADLLVVLIDDETEQVEQLTLNSDYTVQGAGGEDGGSVTSTVPVPTGKSIRIIRVVELLQLTDLRNQGKFFAEIHEDTFDLIVMMIQQQQEQLDRAVKVPIGSDTPADDLLAEFKQDIADAQEAARESEAARDESQEIADKFGDVDQAIAVTEKMRDEAALSSASAAEDAVRAEVAADAAAISGKIYPSPAAGVDPETGVSEGDYFNVRSPVDSNFIDEYQNVGGVPIPTGKSISSGALVEAVARSANTTSRNLNDSGMLRYTGQSRVPLYLDAELKEIASFTDLDNGVFRFRGLVNNGDMRSAGALNYAGSGPIYPLVLSGNNRVLLGYDTESGSMVGALTTSSGNGSPAIRVDTDNLYVFMTYGQSNSIGARGIPLISTHQPYPAYAKSFSAGPRSEGVARDSFSPLVETLGGSGGSVDRGETPCSAMSRAMIEGLIEEGAEVPEMFFSAPGHGGRYIGQLSKGSTYYQRLMDHVAKVVQLAGRRVVLPAITYVGNEYDAGMIGVFTQYETYKSALIKLQEDLEADIKSITGQDQAVYLLVAPPSSQAGRSEQTITQAILDVSVQSERVKILTPLYHLPVASDGVHLTNYGYHCLGLYAGRELARMIQAPVRNALLAVSATARGQKLRVKYSREIFLNTSDIPEVNNFGIRIVDDLGDVPFDQVETAGEVLSATLGRPLNGAATYRYGLDYTVPGMPNGAAGNISDNEDKAWYALDGTPMPSVNFATHQSMGIIQLV